MAWIEIIHPEDADGPLAEEYDRAMKRAGRVANVLRISSLHPEAMRRWVALYETLMFGPSPLSRAERELTAVVVSQENDCEY